jgi:cellulose synthase/poly-beta-1,6-N-acetylglucosamine synthase-like glycosyltransferase
MPVLLPFRLKLFFPMLFLSILSVLYGLKVIVYLIFLLSGKSTGRKKTGSAKGTPIGSISSWPSVDILLPMYNEERVIAGTIENLLNISYPNFSIIIVNDGSTDQSYITVKKRFGNHPRIRVLDQPNQGKSAAMNNGLKLSGSDIIVCIDADTLVRPDVIEKMIPYFNDPKVASVSGYVKVGNRVNLITEMQYVEYVVNQNYDRILFEPLNSIIVVPGALGAFRRTAVLSVGGFRSDTVAEDCDITIRMLCSGLTIGNVPEAIAYTEAPSSVEMFFQQRVRWTIGLMQGLLKHRKQLSGHANRNLSSIVVPFTWVYRIALPFLAGWLDYYFIALLFFPGALDQITWYLLFIVADAGINYFILRRNGERMNFLKLILLHRIYRQLTIFTWFNIMLRWFKGSLHRWSKIPRKGEVKLD